MEIQQGDINSLANALVAIKNALTDMGLNPANVSTDIIAIQSNLSAFENFIASSNNTLNPVSTTSVATQAILTEQQTPA